MAHRVCPFWIGYLLASPLRRWLHDPQALLRPYVQAGMTVLDIGCAMGFFTLPLAEMVGPTGRVLAVDLQENMLRRMQRRAQKARLVDRIVPRVCGPASLQLEGLEHAVDFALAFAVVHETPDPAAFFREVASVLKPGACCLLAEPKGHVPHEEFQRTLTAAQDAGLRLEATPKVPRCQAALLRK